MLTTIASTVFWVAVGWVLGETRSAWWPTVKNLGLKALEKIGAKAPPK